MSACCAFISCTQIQSGAVFATQASTPLVAAERMRAWLDRLAANMEEVRPTIMFVVPRLFEVLRTRITKAIEKQGGMGVKLLAAAQGIDLRRPLTTSPCTWRR